MTTKEEAERALTSPLWRCEWCGKWIDRSDAGWRWNGTAWEHGGHSNAPQAGHFPARRFGTVAEALAFERAPMIEALRGCVREMERWGADEDGIPEDAWPAYIAAREIMDATVKDAAR